MKKQEKLQILENLCSEINTHDEALFVMYTTKKNGDYYIKGNMGLIATGIREILGDGIVGKENEPATVVAWTILEALREIREHGVSIDALLSAFDDDSDDDESDCADCEMMRFCDDRDAIAYRKAHGIPRPKNNSRTIKFK